MHNLEKISNVLEFVCEMVSSFFILIVTLLLIIQVVLRFGFSTGLPWAEEVAKYLTIWCVMLGAHIMIKRNNLIRGDFLDNLWNPKLSMFRDFVFHVFICFILAILVYQGWTLAEHGRRSMALSLPITLFWAYLAVPVGAALMFFYYLVNICKALAAYLVGISGKETI